MSPCTRLPEKDSKIQGRMSSTPWIGLRPTRTNADIWRWNLHLEVLRKLWRSEEVVDQIAKEYHWTLEALNNRGITPSNP